MGTTVHARRWAVGAAAALSLVAAGLTACVPPTTAVVGLGTHRTAISSIAPATFLYDGTAGDRLNVWSVERDGTVDGYQQHTVTVRGPDGAPLPHVRSSLLSRTVDLPTTGRYRIEVNLPPVNPGTGQVDPGPINVSLILSLDEHRGLASLGYLDRPAPGQHLRWDYPGTAGELLNVYGATVTAPDGTQLVADTLRRGQVELPVTGTYGILVAGGLAALSHDLVGGPLTPGATTTPELLPNQHIDYTVDGSAGDALGVYAGYGNVTLLAPDGSVVDPGTRGHRHVLTQDGVHTVIVTQPVAMAPPLTIWLTEDLEAGALGDGATPVPGLLPGQSVVFDRAGAAGERLLLRTTDGVPGVPPGSRVLDPGGAPVPSTTYHDGTVSWSDHTLSVDGTYRVVVSPHHPPGDSLVVWAQSIAP